MKKLFKIVCLLVCLILIPTTVGCSSKWDTTYYQHMGTLVTINVKGQTVSGTQTQLDIFKFLSDLDEEISTSLDTSYVKKFNDEKKDNLVYFSDQAFMLLDEMIYFYQNVSDKFNPLVYPLVDLWQMSPSKYGGFFEIPSELDIQNTLSLTFTSNLSIDYKNKAVMKRNDGVMLDFGGIAKGYATEEIKKILDKIGTTDGYISLGGSSIYVYSVPDYLGVTHPRNTSSQILRIKPDSVNNKYVSTSGDYQRFYIKNNKRYSHVINPSTGRPVDTGFSSITVVGVDGSFADMLSTALMSFEYEKLSNILKMGINDYDVYAVYCKDGVNEILTNKKQGKDFTLLDDGYTVKEF